MGAGWRCRPMSTATGSWCCLAVVASTLERICWVSAPARVRLPPQVLRLTIAGRSACSARQVVACTPGVSRKVSSASRSRRRWASSPPVRREGRVAGQQPFELVVEAGAANGVGGGVGEVAGGAVVAQRERGEHQSAHRVGDTRLAGAGVFEQLVAAAQQVREAGLVGGVGEAAVRRPAVALDHPCVAVAEDAGGDVVAAAGGDPVDGHPVAGEDPQPRLGAGDAPAGLVGGDRGAAADRRDQRVIGRLAAAPRPGDRAGYPAGGHRHAELAEQRRDPTGGGAPLLDQQHHQRDRPRARLGAGRAQRVGGLLGVARLHPRPAAATAPDRDVEAGHERAHRRQIGGELAGDADLFQVVAAAPRARPAQPDLHDPIDVVGLAAVALGAVAGAGPAARPLVLPLRRGACAVVGAVPAAAERSRLPLRARASASLRCRRRSTSPRNRSLSARSRSSSSRVDAQLTGLQSRDPLAQPRHLARHSTRHQPQRGCPVDCGTWWGSSGAWASYGQAVTASRRSSRRARRRSPSRARRAAEGAGGGP